MRNTCRMVLGVILIALAPTPAAQVDGFYSQPAMHGDRVVFVSEGDLWSARIGGDAHPIMAHRLTSDDGTESHPVISPDGAQVAFAAEYDGNVDVYVMPIDGGIPTRLTYHPGVDQPLSFSRDGRQILFRSRRTHPLGRWELFRVARDGGLPTRELFGECSLASLNAGGKIIAFTQWSNEHWNWNGYRGGTAPDIWLGEFASGRFWKLTNRPANDLFPMWIRGRVYYVSDHDGRPNFYSQDPRGGDELQHTQFTGDDPRESISSFTVRWASADADESSSRIVFAQGAQLAVLNTADNTITRLPIRLASDRVGVRARFVDVDPTITEFALSPDGSQLVVGTRGEWLRLPVGRADVTALASDHASREWGGAWLDRGTIVGISDRTGEQQIIRVGVTETDTDLSFLTGDREDWLFPPVCSPDGTKVAFADKTHRLHLLNIDTGQRDIVDRSDAWEIVEYAFSPDSQWLAYTKPMRNGFGRVHLYSVRTGRTLPVTDGLFNEHQPTWDPKGQYLYYLSDCALNPTLGTLDFEHVFTEATRVMVVPLRSDVPPPLSTMAKYADWNLESWADADSTGGRNVSALDDPAEPGATSPMRIDLGDIRQRSYALDVEPARITMLRAVYGGVIFIRRPIEKLLDEVWPPPPPGRGNGTMIHFDCVEAKATDIAGGVTTFSLSADNRHVAYLGEKVIHVRPLHQKDKEVQAVALDALPLHIDIASEWRQIFEEAWRLQRDFFWSPTMRGVDWNGVRSQYAVLLPRVGTRAELNDLLGQMFSELRTSHTYISGGDAHDRKEPVGVGLLGVELEWQDGAYRITQILSGAPWDSSLRSPLAAPHLRARRGDAVVAIDGKPIARDENPHAHLQGRSGRPVTLTLRDAEGVERLVTINAMEDDAEARLLTWVEENRALVDERTQEQVGYVYLPDMDGAGLVNFARYFYGQIQRDGLIVDIRGNRGGFVSQMLIERLARTIWAFQQPRHGLPATYPSRAFHGHIVVLMDQHAGSDGDIFPESFRIREIGPLIGTRTWGGVVGIRMDKPFVDMGVSSQPEFAWWEPNRGWSLENSGVEPDIEVPITPHDRAIDFDPQLAKAIEIVMQRIESDPPRIPDRPDY